MKIWIIPNVSCKDTEKTLNQLEDLLKESEVLYEVDHSNGRTLPVGSFDAVISVGGDGTFVRSAKIAHRLRVPLAGIHTGTLGYLMSMTKDHFEEQLKRILMEGFRKECSTYTLLNVNTEIGNMTAVNEISLMRTASPAVFTLKQKDGKVLLKSRASGFLFSTAIGTTGFAHSAGGAGIVGDLPLFEAVCVCPMDSNDRPLILDAGKEYELTADKEVYFSLDGEEIMTVAAGSTVFLKKEKELLYVR